MKKIFIDMMGRPVELNVPPKRIVSLVPSQTELLYDLDLNEEVVGITKFCVHPTEWFRTKKRIGGTKTVNIEIVKALQPDLVIANKEENTKEQIDELSTLFPTWVSDIRTVDEALEMIVQIGAMTNRTDKATQITKGIMEGITQLARNTSHKRVAYFIWRNPWMCAGGDTFINDMISKVGWINVIGDKIRYPEVKLGELKEKQPEIILLSSEPYPFKDRHIAEIKEILPEVDVKLIDGEMMSWYGSRMLLATSYLKDLQNIP